GAATGADVGGPAPGVLVGAELVQLRRAALRRLPVQLLQKRDAPAAAGACPAALRQLAGHPRPLDAQELQQLPPRHAEAGANLLVQDRVRRLGHRSSCRHHTTLAGVVGGRYAKREEATVNKPIILCGLGRVGWAVLEFLKTANLHVVAIDLNCAP